MTTNTNNHSIGVQFSGKPKVYYYSIHPTDDIKVGGRVVVPTGVKQDGTLAMSIATCVERLNTEHAESALPIVQSLSQWHMDFALTACVEVEAAKLEAAK